MKDMQAQAEKLRTDAAECALIRDLATEPHKRELFNRLAEHLNTLADSADPDFAHPRRRLMSTIVLIFELKAARERKPLPSSRSE
ncbi:hypothetical protein [Bradyrhizobium sp. 195]|uniref:hypothetical protein n=1 Tax=Bradyrhizobium sp. 195 TaxID=2782662 RepID=UPI0020006541|nr:hypothetical protein [Bradyrhizobium sp. 195]UPK31341.1 hypothetical protein IVB26_40470 [Bradyrhizobium sp. 195]